MFLCVSDVDVPDPDEKSLMTYVSSLYDVFPEVPPLEQTLIDNVSRMFFRSYGISDPHQIVVMFSELSLFIALNNFYSGIVYREKD